MTEQQLQKKILNYLNSLPDCWVVKTVTTNKNGTPDILACYKGYFIALEVKRPGRLSEVSKIQQYQIDTIKKCGGVAAAVDSVEKAQKIMFTFSNTCSNL